MSYPNLVNTPEKFGLEVLDRLDEPDMSWEFNTLALFADTKSKRLYVGTDSGCSCPSPFEDMGIDALEHVVTEDQLERTVNSWCRRPDWKTEPGESEYFIPQDERLKFIATGKMYLKRFRGGE